MGFRAFPTKPAIHLLTIAIALAGMGSAVFTDTQPLGANTFNTDTVDVAASPASTFASLPAMAPGDKVTAPLTISNGGPRQVHYAIRSTTTEDILASQLEMTIMTDVSDCSNSGFDADGTQMYGPGDLGSTRGLIVVGATTPDAEIVGRLLEAHGSEQLCIQISLPLDTGNAYQGMATGATLKVIAQ